MKFLRNDLEGCRVPDVHAHLVRLTFDEMLAIVRDPEFHPAVRYNALTIIASLNDVDAVRLTSSGAVPEPMARALPVLLDEYRRPENSEALKVAALIGLSRHLEWDPHRPAGSAPIPAALRTEVMNEMLTLAQAKATVPGRSAEGHLWFRRRAVEALGLASVAKADPVVAAALDKMLKDDSEPLPLRFAVAAAMGRMKADPAVKVDVAAVAKELGYLALQACDTELTRVSTLKKDELERAARLAKGVSTFTGSVEGSSSGGGVAIDSSIASSMMPEANAMGPAGGGSGLLQEDPKGYRFDPVRRRIRYYLYCVQLGLNGGVEKNPTNGIAGVAKAPKDVQLIADVNANVAKLAKVIEVDAVDMAQLDKDLRKVMKDLEKFARKAAPPPAPADLPAGDLPAAPPAGDAPAGPAIEAAAAGGAAAGGAAAAGAAAEDVPAAGAAPAAPGAVAAPAVP
jgi:hypothetical protein